MTRQADFKRRVTRANGQDGGVITRARAPLRAPIRGGSRALADRALHVTNGDATVPGLRGAGVVDTISRGATCLHEARCTDVPDHELRGIRARFLAARVARTSDGFGVR